MKSSFLIFFFLIFALSAEAQEPCPIRSKTTPALHNLRLEMLPAEVQSVLGRELKIKIKRTGERTFFQNFIDKPSPATVPGVRALYLRFFNGKLYQIEIFYQTRAELKTLNDFTDHLSAVMNLQPPAAAWQTAKGRSEIRCSETSIVADFVLNPRVEITDETARAQILELRKKKK